MMSWKVHLVAALLLVAGAVSYPCPPEMGGRCICGETQYLNQLQYVVNCTNAGFTDTTALQHLPNQTEVLIFTGNNISELPWNVFGTLQNLEHLQIVDMSNNQIQEVMGKSYHRVANVQRLILNHNRISISEDQHHPRIFSNFINLQELHLTNAFEDNSDDLDRDLRDIFISSNLTKLRKLHLEQNEVSTFKEKLVFCDLPQLMDLHLGDNRLKGLDFEIECLNSLRFIDLEGNNITRLSPRELSLLDKLPARNQSLKIDIGDNPFSCECGIEELFDWLNRTKVTVRDVNRLRCRKEKGERRDECHGAVDVVTLVEPPHAGTSAVLALLCLALISLLVFLIYTNRSQIRQKLTPMVETVSRKVYYSSIVNNDDQEVDV